MKGDLIPRIIIVERDDVTAIRQPPPSPSCGNPCTPKSEMPCDWCCYQKAKDLLLSIFRPEPVVTPDDEREAAYANN